MKTWKLSTALLSAAMVTGGLGCESSEVASSQPDISGRALFAHNGGHERATHVRWDIAAIDAGTVVAGGMGSARASTGGMAPPTANPTEIRLTGAGTFVAPRGPGSSNAVTGGGTWETFAGGASTGSGTYRVTGLVRWDQAPASLPAALEDGIADRNTSSAGLAVLSVKYSDGSHGVLIVSCSFGVPGVFEGVTASKGFVDYWSAPRGAETTLTIFHILRGGDDDHD